YSFSDLPSVQGARLFKRPLLFARFEAAGKRVSFGKPPTTPRRAESLIARTRFMENAWDNEDLAAESYGDRVGGVRDHRLRCHRHWGGFGHYTGGEPSFHLHRPERPSHSVVESDGRKGELCSERDDD